MRKQVINSLQELVTMIIGIALMRKQVINSLRELVTMIKNICRNMRLIGVCYE